MINFALGIFISLLLLGFSPYSLQINQFILLIIVCLVSILNLAPNLFIQLTKKTYIKQYCNIWLLLGLLLGTYQIQNQLLRYQAALASIPSSQIIKFKVIQIRDKTSRIQILQATNPNLNGYFADFFWDLSNEPILGQHYQGEVELSTLTNHVNPSQPTKIFSYAGQKLIAYAKSKKDTKIIITPLSAPSWIDRQRNTLHQYLSQNYPQSAAFLSALSIGITADIKQEEWLIYRNTGVSHLMAISGLHLSLIAGWSFIILRFIAGIFLSKGLQRIHPF